MVGIGGAPARYRPAMGEPTVFTRIISGELPGRFVWRDEPGPHAVVAFLTIAPIRPGHVLVVPTGQVDQWTDLDPATWARMCEVAHTVSKAQRSTFECERVGVIVAGLEVPHCHLHLVPIRTEADLSFANADHGAAPDALDEACARIVAALG